MGVDVSGAMLQVARRRGGYTELLHGDVDEVLPALRDAGRTFELVLAADTLIYYGELRHVFQRVAALLSDGGGEQRALFALSLERLPADDARPWALQSSGTYAHSLHHVREAAARAGLQVEAHDESQSPRLEDGEPVPGLLVVLSRA